MYILKLHHLIIIIRRRTRLRIRIVLRILTGYKQFTAKAWKAAAIFFQQCNSFKIIILGCVNNSRIQIFHLHLENQFTQRAPQICAEQLA